MCFDFYEVYEALWEEMNQCLEYLDFERDMASGDPWAEENKGN